MTNTLSLPLLDRVQIASPCHMKWEEMTGDERVRHCAACDLNVHNLSAMTREEAEGLLASAFNEDGSRKGGRFCGGIFRRADGTILTQDCPVGLARLKRAARVAAARVAAIVGVTALVGWITSKASANGWDSLTDYEPLASLTKIVNLAGVTKPVPLASIKGEIYIPPRVPAATTNTPGVNR